MTKVKYVDGFVFTIPKKNKAAYKKMAKEAAKVWMKYGALEYKECFIEDEKPEWVALTFPKLTKAKKSETIGFAYIAYKSKAHRNQVNKKVMDQMKKDEEAGKHKDMKMPFDPKKMAYAGFKVEVSG